MLNTDNHDLSSWRVWEMTSLAKHSPMKMMEKTTTRAFVWKPSSCHLPSKNQSRCSVVGLELLHLYSGELKFAMLATPTRRLGNIGRGKCWIDALLLNQNFHSLPGARRDIVSRTCVCILYPAHRCSIFFIQYVIDITTKIRKFLRLI